MIDLQLKMIQELEQDAQTVSFDGHLRPLTKAELKRYAELSAGLQLLYDESRKQMFLEQSPLVYPVDIYLVYAFRDKPSQDQAVAGGFSKLHWPNSTHNKNPSEGLDTAPIIWKDGKYQLDWNDLKRFRYMNELMTRVAKRLQAEGKIKSIRFGADFNGDGNLTNDRFVDLPHCEVKKC